MKLIAAALMVAWTALNTGAAELEWMTDLTKAKAKAKTEKKMVLMDFTGSDWCPPCMSLHKNVLTAPEFETFAKENLVLVVVDFPRRKKLSPDQQKANDDLSKQFGVNAFPTVFVLNSDGKQIHKEEGYGGTSVKEYVATLTKLKGK